MIYITRRERFSSAHRLFRSDWDEAKNMEHFGKCANPNWHGHNYELFVTVKGKINPETGFIMNLSTLSRLIQDNVIKKLDHKNINLETDFMNGKIVSTENIAFGIWNELFDKIKDAGAALHCVKLVETENNYVEYYGE